MERGRGAAECPPFCGRACTRTGPRGGRGCPGWSSTSTARGSSRALRHASEARWDVDGTARRVFQRSIDDDDDDGGGNNAGVAPGRGGAQPEDGTAAAVAASFRAYEGSSRRPAACWCCCAAAPLGSIGGVFSTGWPATRHLQGMRKAWVTGDRVSLAWCGLRKSRGNFPGPRRACGTTPSGRRGLSL